MTIEYGVSVYRINNPLSKESIAVLEFMDSDEKIMAIHFDDVETAKNNVTKFYHLKIRRKLSYGIIRRQNTVFVIKEGI